MQDTTAQQGDDVAQIKALSVYYEIATRRLDDRTQQRRALDGKAATAFIGASSVLPLFVGLLAVGPLPTNPLAQGAVVGLVLGAAALYVVLLVLLYRAYQVDQWAEAPALDDLQRYCRGYTDDALHEWVADAYLAVITDNEPRLKRKARYLDRALRVFPCEALLLVAAAAVTLVAR